MLHRNFGPNLIGRDFIVADLHGCYEMLSDALRLVSFNKKEDRLFSVGDLADRGPESFKCLELLREPWFFAVLGNHEDLLLSAACRNGGSWQGSGDYLRNDGKWLRELTPLQLVVLKDDLLPRVSMLPFSIHVEAEDLGFNVVHAQAGSAAGRVFGDDDLRFPHNPDLRESLLWGRELLESDAVALAWGASTVLDGVRVSPTPFADGLSLTYVGHSIVPGPFLHQSHLFFDGGAYTGLPGTSLLLLEHKNVAALLATLSSEFAALSPWVSLGAGARVPRQNVARAMLN